MLLFEAELAAVAHVGGASPREQIVLVLQRAVWHCTKRLHVSHQVHWLFLPPYSPALRPAAHVSPLVSGVNRDFASFDELEDAQATCCVAPQARPDRMRSTILFH